MSTEEFLADRWIRILGFLRISPGIYVGKEEKCRRFLAGVLWIARTGAQWRALPEQYGKWNSVYKRFGDWCEKGVWKRMHEAFADDPDMEHLLLDSTIVRAHPCAGGARKKRGAKGRRGWAGAEAGSAAKSI
jgi:transposase